LPVAEDGEYAGLVGRADIRALYARELEHALLVGWGGGGEAAAPPPLNTWPLPCVRMMYRIVYHSGCRGRDAGTASIPRGTSLTVEEV
jgi:hypothetical protein